MNFQVMQKQLRSAKLTRNMLMVVAGVMLAANGALVSKLVLSSNQIILVPSSVSDGMVARGAFDKRYMEALALDAVYALYNASPANLEYGRTVIERVSAVADRVALLKQYDAIAKDIRERKISTVFFPEEVRHFGEQSKIVVQGTLQTYVETVQVATEPRAVLVTFKREAGSARVSKIHKTEVQS